MPDYVQPEHEDDTGSVRSTLQNAYGATRNGYRRIALLRRQLWSR